ncbi:MAG: hypothetical protein ACTSXH_12865 [Promethearchaeota archaeon]
MIKITQTGYCPHCKQNVLLVREKMDICLLVILSIFTIGFGLIIYLIYYYSKPENRCIHCYSIVELPNIARTTEESREKLPYQESKPEMSLYQSYTPPELERNVILNEHSTSNIRYCPFCGGEIKSDHKYCPNCASKLK